jgi:serine/threonine protein kinase
MAPSNDFLLKLLRARALLTAEEAAAVTDWWLAERQDEEHFVAFLRRQNVLTADVVRQLELMEKGRLVLGRNVPLFSGEGWQRLRQRLHAAGDPTQDAAVEVTVRGRIPQDSPPLARPGADPQSRATATSAQAPRQSAGAGAAVGTVLGKYLLTARVGRGGSSTVFRARHDGLGIPVAVKVLRPDVSANAPEVRERFQAEARVLARLNHPNIVRLWDFDDQGPCPYLVMEYVEGCSLAELIRQCGRLRLDQAVSLLAQVVHGLAAAWKLGLVHQDVKPANILVGHGEVKVADLGLAVRAGGRASGAVTGGTAAYMSPEQIAVDAPLDHRADIYALGVTFYFAVTGHLPFPGRTCREVLLKHLEGTIVPPHELNPDLSPAVSRFIAKAMAKDPDERYQTAEELLAALRGLVDLDAEEELTAAGTRSSRSLWRKLFGRIYRG